MKLKILYNISKSAKVGDSVKCPSCKTVFIKSSYQQVFCKTKPKTQCKDFYWNNVIETKRNNVTRISPTNAAFQNNEQRIADREDRLYNELNFEGGGQDGNIQVDRCEWCGYINCRCDYTFDSEL